jgi:hypothetical protein
VYLRDCLALLFPAVEAGIDWSRPHTFLDTELQQIVRDADLGMRRADRLVQVWLPDGEDAWLLIHMEVQSRQEQGFAKRMFVYYYRIVDDYNREVISLAVLADERPRWRPRSYRSIRFGSGVRYNFLVAKLTDWRSRRAELEASDNPFATVVLAHLAAQDTRGDANSRERAKLHLIRRLYERGYSRERVSVCSVSSTGSWRSQQLASSASGVPSSKSRRNTTCRTPPAWSAWRARKAARKAAWKPSATLSAKWCAPASARSH